MSPVYAPLAPDAWLADTYRVVLADVGRTPMTPDEERTRPVGSTDMGNVTQVLPAIHPSMAIDCGDAVNHQPEFAAACATPSADQAVLDSALAMAWTAVAAASDDDERSRLLAGVQARRDALVGVGAGGAA